MKKEIRIMCLGDCLTGKSTFINEMLGYEAAKVFGGSTGTQKTKEYKIKNKKYDIDEIYIDTKGFGISGTLKKQMNRVIDEYKKNNHEINIILYFFKAYDIDTTEFLEIYDIASIPIIFILNQKTYKEWTGNFKIIKKVIDEKINIHNELKILGLYLIQNKQRMSYKKCKNCNIESIIFDGLKFKCSNCNKPHDDVEFRDRNEVYICYKCKNQNIKYVCKKFVICCNCDLVLDVKKVGYLNNCNECKKNLRYFCLKYWYCEDCICGCCRTKINNEDFSITNYYCCVKERHESYGHELVRNKIINHLYSYKTLKYLYFCQFNFDFAMYDVIIRINK